MAEGRFPTRCPHPECGINQVGQIVTWRTVLSNEGAPINVPLCFVCGQVIMPIETQPSTGAQLCALFIRDYHVALDWALKQHPSSQPTREALGQLLYRVIQPTGAEPEPQPKSENLCATCDHLLSQHFMADAESGWGCGHCSCAGFEAREDG